MGFFTKNDAADDVLAPLTEDRLAAQFERRGERYGRNDHGQIGGFWDGHLYFFYILTQGLTTLQVRARWNRDLPLSEYSRLLEILNAWSRDKIWPKVYVVADRVDGEQGEPDSCSVFAELAVNYPHGLTDAQLDEHLSCALGTIGQFFEHLDGVYPEVAARAKEEQQRRIDDAG